MNTQEIRRQIDVATKLVQAWPDWKRNILVHSAQPTVVSPRTPVNNQISQGDQQQIDK